VIINLDKVKKDKRTFTMFSIKIVKKI